MVVSPPQTSDPRQAALDQPPGTINGVFEPPNGLVLSAISRNKLIIFLMAIVCALIGAGIGSTRSQKTYTASATLQIGQVNPNSPGFYSYVQSSAALATAFSRAIAAEQVLAAVHHKLKLTTAQTVARLTATPVPQSPTLRVIATGPTGSEAIQLANVGANALIAYEGKSNSANPQAASLLHEYREASLQLKHTVVKLGQLQRLSSGRHITGSALANLLAPNEADKNAAAVRLKAIAVAYTAAVSSQAPRRGLVSLLAGATSASSNRNSKIEIFGFVGLLVGVVLGCAVATLRERRRIGRRSVASVEA